MNTFYSLNTHCFSFYPKEGLIRVTAKGLRWVDVMTLLDFLEKNEMRILKMKLRRIGEDNCLIASESLQK